MNDFIFGTLATQELRLALTRSRLAGVTHIQKRTPRDPLPGEPIILKLSTGPDQPGDTAWVYWTSDGTDPQGSHGLAEQGHVTRMEFTGESWEMLLWGYVRHFSITLPGLPDGSVLRYRLSAAGAGGLEVFADQGAYYACYIADDSTPEWTRNAVIYQIFVDRFNPGTGQDWFKPEYPSGFYGGRIRGITEKLDYISELGANVLWLTPIFPSPSHHGYDATDLFEVEPRLGTKADLKELLDAAHQRGMRVLLDFVPNHWSHLHATFQDAVHNPESPYRDWYTFKHWPDEYESFFGVKELPQVNLRNPAARQSMLDAVAYWLDFGVDGYRVDYALGPTPDFWADFRRVTRSVKPDCWTFGEVVEPSDAQLSFEGGLDGCLDFILLEGLRRALAFNQWTGAQLADFLVRHEGFFPVSFSRPSFLDNHDMNRFLWAAGGDKRRLRLAALCQFVLPGPPILYYGTEIGLSQERDVRQGSLGLPEESRLPMLWGSEMDLMLLADYQALTGLRKDLRVLQEAGMRVLMADDNSLLFQRGECAKGVCVALNLSEQPRLIPLPAGFEQVRLAMGTWDMKINGSGDALLELGGLAGVVLVQAG
jgi:cyclomaltodextrinase